MKFLLAVSILAGLSATTQAFAPVTISSPSFIAKHDATIRQPRTAGAFRPQTFLAMSASTETLPEAKSMRVGELKKELESYGMSTKSFLEKSELVDAVDKARAEGKTPKEQQGASTSTSSSSSSSNSSTSASTSSESASSSSSSSESRTEKLAQEMEKCKSMKAGELKKELESYGIPTASFFEKSEFVKACAEARVDGASKQSSGTGGSSSSSSSGSDEEGYAEYADVEVLTDDNAGPRKKSSEQSQGQGQGGGGGGMPGGMGGMADMMKNMGMGGGGGGGGMPGGMGGMADMMKNMGMGGGGGGMPGGMGGMADMMKNMGMGGGGGGGGMPGGMGGDTMKKAQQMMSNPKVMEIISKAQSNPKIMKAVQECMGNPAAFAKYQNDPEVGELIRELQKYMQ